MQRILLDLFKDKMGMAGIAAIVFVVAVALTGFWGTPGPVCCDAVSYGQLAAAYQRDGLLTPHEVAKIRTYLYPAILALIQAPERLSSARAGAYDPVVFYWQALLFLTAVLSLSLAVRRFGIAAQASVIIGLLLNIFVLVYIPVRLTEILSLACFILIIAAAVELAGADLNLRRKPVTLFLCGSFLVGASVMVRPANIALAPCWILFALVYLWRLVRSCGGAKEIWKIVGLGMVGVMMFGMPLVPQWLINTVVFERSTIFPVVELGSQQLAWGITHIKYVTLITQEGARGLIYPNPFLIDSARYIKEPLLYYIENPFSGLMTIILHLFNSVTFDYLHPYVTDLRPWYLPAILAANHFVVFSGLVVGACLIHRRLQHWRTRGARLQLHDTWWLLLCLALAAICVLNSFVAVESRFGLPVIAVLGPLACYGLFSLALHTSRRRRTAFALSALAYVLAAEAVSFWMLDLALSQSAVSGA
ncbi:hypothetical protein ACFOYU_12555 [Microvirga sp. GCM10011540]|uniref:hypothetical protein n=1 Tax=Microvirga sp. GCM10011540 TaxID=3317338 RepID=UPI003621E340